MRKKLFLISGLFIFSTMAHSSDLVVSDFKEASGWPVKEKKDFFFNNLYELVLVANDNVEKERVEIKKSNEIASYCTKYRVEDCTKENLFKKVNVIPPSLALAQAANESAWGTSRFAQKANNLFGEWCFSKGCGIVPLSRPEGKTYEVEKFSILSESVASYIHNLNSHPAYEKLREAREVVGVNGYEVAVGLESYSARGEKYIKEIQSMIEYNKLQEYDKKFNNKK